MKKETVNLSKAIEKKHGTSYYIATLFLPEQIKKEVFVLYAFVRTPDEYVDNPKENENPKEKLEEWKKEWQKVWETGESKNEILVATREIFKKYDIPFEISIEFIDSMIQDLTINRYRTYEDLQKYMRGSAESVGVMLTYIFGYTEKRAFDYARKLGEAMQLTNFLRDINEDYEQRNRIYLPMEDLERLSITEDDIKNKNVNESFKELIKHLIHKARGLYKESKLGINMLSHKTQFGVRVASRLYEKILDKIEKQNYDIYKKRARTNLLEKIRIILKTYVTH